MLDKRQRRMTPEEFYAWQEPMDEKYELVDGYPVKRCPDAELMTGASQRHDRIVWNLIRAVGNQLGDGPCQGFTSDTAVRSSQQTEGLEGRVALPELDISFSLREVYGALPFRRVPKLVSGQEP